MHKILQRTLLAYRPLYLRGLLLDGQFRLPKANPTEPGGTPRLRQRRPLAALIQIVFHHRSK